MPPSSITLVTNIGFSMYGLKGKSHAKDAKTTKPIEEENTRVL
jgi:hypothetical protein